MTDKDYQEMKKEYLEMVKKIMTDTGGLAPHITVLGVRKEDGYNSIVHIPIDSKFMKDEDAKDRFVDKMIPEIAEKISEEFQINAVAWASEAWMRVADAKTADPATTLANWKSLPIKKEVLIITVESDKHNESNIYEIVRNGKQVNSDGRLIDNINLVQLDFENAATAEGRFTGLYKKFTE